MPRTGKAACLSVCLTKALFHEQSCQKVYQAIPFLTFANLLSETPASVVSLLARALQRIRTTPPRVIASPPTREFSTSVADIALFSNDYTTLEPRRAAVALIIRIVPSPSLPSPPQPTNPPNLSEFFELDWVTDPNARPEILFLHRENSLLETGSRSREAQVAFPGGRTDPDDEGGLYTGETQTL